MFTIALRTRGPVLTDTRLAARVEQEIRAALMEMGALGQRLLVERTPRGVSSGGGGLRGSAFNEQIRGRSAGIAQRIAFSAFYAPIVEAGRRPGRRPPIAPILLWVTRKLSVTTEAQRVAFLVARKIGRVGYPGAHMVERTYRQLLGIVRGRVAALNVRIADLLRGGR